MPNLYEYHSRDITYQHALDRMPENCTFEMHAHDRYELYYFLSGTGEYYVEGIQYRLEPGCILLMNPGETHQFLISGSTPYERVMIHFTDKLLGQIIPQRELFRILNDRPVGVGNFFPADQINQPLIRACFEALNQQLQNRLYVHHNLRTALFSYCVPILLDMERYYLNEGHNLPTTAEGQINNIIAYINEHLAEDISLDRLSKEFFISKSNMNMKFKKATGTTVWDFILTKRLMSAHIKILNGESIRTAYQQSGFRDYSSFYRRYVQKFGVSPAQSRKMSE